MLRIQSLKMKKLENVEFSHVKAKSAIPCLNALSAFSSPKCNATKAKAKYSSELRLLRRKRTEGLKTCAKKENLKTVGTKQKGARKLVKKNNNLNVELDTGKCPLLSPGRREFNILETKTASGKREFSIKDSLEDLRKALSHAKKLLNPARLSTYHPLDTPRILNVSHSSEEPTDSARKGPLLIKLKEFLNRQEKPRALDKLINQESFESSQSSSGSEDCSYVYRLLNLPKRMSPETVFIVKDKAETPENMRDCPLPSQEFHIDRIAV